MTRLFVKISIVSFLNIMFYSYSNAQLDCRSMIGAYIKPISKNSPFSWGTELTLAPGVMNDRFIFNSLAIGAFEYSGLDYKHKFYFEGAAKYWYNSAEGPGLDGIGTGYIDFTSTEKQHFGLRELFYSYNNTFDFKVGIQSVKSPDYLLIDERVLGISTRKTFGSISFDVQGGTVYKDIARMRDICGVRHIYNLVRGGKVSFVGDEPGDSNFALASITWKNALNNKFSTGDKTDGIQENSESDEFDSFESDDFSSFSEVRKDLFNIDHAGFLFYEEFGSQFYDYKYYGGVFATFNLTHELSCKGEIIQQITTEANATFFLADFGKQISWKNGSLTDIKAQFLGYLEQDKDIQFYPSFSNLFLGEITRLDAMHSPLFSISANHLFLNRNKLMMKLNYVRQLKTDKTQELDFITGLRIHKHIKLTTVLGYVTSGLLSEDNFLARAELRIAF